MTLKTFTEALLTPDLSFKTLCTARAATGADGMPSLVRTTRFAEAQIDFQGEQWLLFLPLSPAALAHIERTASALRGLHTDNLASYRLLPGEMRWRDAAGREQRCDLVLQHLPAGCDFAEALRTQRRESLLAALGTLQEALRALGFTHRNLKAENLRWSAGRFIPLRYHDARLGDTADGDAEAFDALRRAIDSACGTGTVPQQVGDVTGSYTAQRPLTGHRWVSHTFEGLICVEDEAGYGFVDEQNCPIIAAQYLWAGDFREGRAEVQTPDGMGLIDREGRYVIPAEFEIVDYDPAESIARVRQNGRWALYDYLGRRLTEFRPEVPEACGSEIC